MSKSSLHHFSGSYVARWFRQPQEMFDRAIAGGIGLQICTLLLAFLLMLLIFAAVITVVTLVSGDSGSLIGERLWKMYHIFVDPGNGISAATEWTWEKRLGVICIGIFGSILFSGLLISTISNIMERRVDALKSGNFRYGHINNHHIILGYDDLVPGLINGLLADAPAEERVVILTGQDVVMVKSALFSQLDDELADRIVVYFGNINSREDLKDLNFNEAIDVYVMGEENEIGRDSKNIECLSQINSLYASKSGDPLAVYVQFNRISSYSSIQKFKLPADYYSVKVEKKDADGKVGTEERLNLYYRPFNFYEMWARRLWGLYRDYVAVTDAATGSERMMCKYDQLDFADTQTLFDTHATDDYVHLVIVGFNRMGRALLLEALRVCHYHGYDDRMETAKRHKTRITVVDRLIDDMKQQFESQFPNIDTQIYDIDVEYLNLDISSSAMRDNLRRWSAEPHCQLTVAVCVYEPDLGLSLGLSLPPEVYESETRVLIRQEKLNGLGKFIDVDAGGRFRNVRIFGMHADAIASEALNDRLPAYIHYNYCANRNASGRDYISELFKAYVEMLADPSPENKKQFKALSDEAMLPWYNLSENEKWANRYQIDCYRNYCKAVGYDVVPLEEDEMPVIPDVFDLALADENMSYILASMEKYRWNAERTIDGWRYAPVRDNANFKHPQLVENSVLYRLADVSRRAEYINNNVSVIRSVPELLALGGYKMVRKPQNIHQ